MPDAAVAFDTIGRSAHPAFEGVALKHIVTSEKTDEQFSFHLVRIAPNKRIGNHTHENSWKRMRSFFVSQRGDADLFFKLICEADVVLIQGMLHCKSFHKML